MDVHSHNACLCLPFVRSQNLSTGVLLSWICWRFLHTSITNEALVRNQQLGLQRTYHKKFLLSFLWLMYLNPSYYGYAGMLRLVLPGLQTGCDYQSTIECYPDTGAFWIDDFGIDEVQPYLYLLVSLVHCCGS